MIKIIGTTNGEAFIVDKEDVEMVEKYNWFAKKNKHGDILAIKRTSNNNRSIYLHRELLGLIKGDGKEVNHKNIDPSDNTRRNLEIVSREDNARWKKKQRNNKSGYTGVHWNDDCEKWRVQISVNSDLKDLGVFTDIKEAGRAYNEAARFYHGKYAKQNIIKE
jgi:hypothetical protein